VWIDTPLVPGKSHEDWFGCQGDGCKRGKARHEPVIAGWQVVPEHPLATRFRLCRKCRDEWQRVWDERGQG
jgi:hypothetical protein